MKNQYAYLLTYLWLNLLLLVGCAKPKQDEVVPVGSAAAMAGNWVLVDPASTYIVTLQISDGGLAFIEHYRVQFAGQGPVNTYEADASFSIRPSIESGATGTGTVSNVTATKKAGSTEAMRIETDYFTKLAAVNKTELVGADKLRLSYGGAAPGMLVYRRQ